MAASSPRSRRLIWIGLVVFLIVAAAIAIPVGITQSNKNPGSRSSGSSSGSSGSTSSATPGANSLATSGVDGSMVMLDSGSEVQYVNSFGGDWRFDLADAEEGGILRGGRSNDWTPRIGETWTWGKDIARGVNLGGWLVLEPFISPGIFEEWRNKTGVNIIDEYTLCQAMGDEKEAALTAHYETFITEQDFIEIAAAGLNYVRVPIGFWAVETQEGEPFLERVSWTYFLKAVKWARKYGLRINMDLHALPGSQNGWNHSGRGIGKVNVLASVMGIANAERSLSVMRSLVQFASRPENTDVIQMFSIVNEVSNSVIPRDALESFYLEAHRTLRVSTGLNKGPMLAYIDQFSGPNAWSGFASGADRLVLDQHPYLAFDPSLYEMPIAQKSTLGCLWAGATNTSSSRTGVTIAGEFSAALTDCAWWLNSIGPNGTSTSVLPEAVCSQWRDWRKWTDEQKDQVRNLILDEFDALQNFFFWTWKIGESSVLGYASAADWHYRLGLQEGWIPRDPRVAIGRCAAKTDPAPIFFDGDYPPYATGGGDGQVVAAQTASRPWPPLSLMSIATPANGLPRYTPTGTMVTLPAATYTQGSTTVTLGSGWTNLEDTQGAFVPISGCAYPDTYDAGFTVPAAAATCTGDGTSAVVKRRAAPRRMSAASLAQATPTHL